MVFLRTVLGRGIAGPAALHLPERNKRRSLPPRIELGVETNVISTLDANGRPQAPTTGDSPDATHKETPSSNIPRMPSGDMINETPLGTKIETPLGKTSGLTVNTGTTRSTPLGIKKLITLLHGAVQSGYYVFKSFPTCYCF